ncbi:MAG: hypothetical protein M0Z80_06485 [Treponema sp.]|nr:hypothetical protein [Treponema sp.]
MLNPPAPSSGSRRVSPSTAAAAGVAVLLACACSPPAGPTVAGLLPSRDLSPPQVLDAGPSGERGFGLRFDEEVSPVEGSFALEPAGIALSAASRGAWLDIAFSSDQVPGADYALAGEVADAAGNHSRFLFRFVGWNGRPPTLRLSELQTAKNSSTLHPHRDFIELEVVNGGNMGGVMLEWASSIKAYSYRFPSIEVEKGERVVLHLAPESLSEEKDETGTDLAASGGVDASPAGRDLWSLAGGLPDESGVVALRWRPGGEIVDGLFYAAESKSGPLPNDKLAAAFRGLVDAGLWTSAGALGAWEDAFRWKPSVSRSINRAALWPNGPSGWYLSESSGQSPGAANPPPP